MDLGLQGQVVLVTGAGQGLGREIGVAFAREGAHVAFHYRSSGTGAEEAAAEAGALTGAAMAVQADIRSDDEVAAMVEAVEGQLGPIGVLVNNAAATGAKPFLDTTPDDWSFQVDVTVTGTLRVTQAVTRRMVERKAGTIVSLMGDSGRVGESGLSVTATTRATTMALTKSLAKELARHGIRANCVSIGLVQTDRLDEHAGLGSGGAPDEERMRNEKLEKILALYPLRRLGRPSDVSPLVLLLASPLSALDHRPGGLGQRRLLDGVAGAGLVRSPQGRPAPPDRPGPLRERPRRPEHGPRRLRPQPLRPRPGGRGRRHRRPGGAGCDRRAGRRRPDLHRHPHHGPFRAPELRGDVPAGAGLAQGPFRR